VHDTVDVVGAEGEERDIKPGHALHPLHAMAVGGERIP
jgi:hypothetical protein